MAWSPPRTSLASMVVLLGAGLLGAASLMFGTSLRLDPEGWLRWGREVAIHDGRFSTVDYPSWKPLPLLATAPLAFLGSLGPTLWLVLARSAGILALFFIFD